MQVIKSLLMVVVLSFSLATAGYASEASVTMDRISLVKQQIDLLKKRIEQNKIQLNDINTVQNEVPLTIEKTSKNLLDKINLEISVINSDLDGINIELDDSTQSISWLEKSIQEIENQLNIMTMFNLKSSPDQVTNIPMLQSDLAYQKQLLKLENIRRGYLLRLQSIASNTLQAKREYYNHINLLLRSRRLLQLKQVQVKDELAYQEQQNTWLQKLNQLYARSAQMSPADSRESYSDVERDIFYASENANLAYTQSLLARYKDQLQQMHLAISQSNSISLFNEVTGQVQILTRQVTKLDTVLASRMQVLDKHISNLSQRKNNVGRIDDYLSKLRDLLQKYKLVDASLKSFTKQLAEFRGAVDQALQLELSARQGLPAFSSKMLLDLGKELLLVPPMIFQVAKSFTSHFLNEFAQFTWWSWLALGILQTAWIAFYLLIQRGLQVLLADFEARQEPNSKWLSVEWLYRNCLDLFLIGNVIGIMRFFSVPYQSFLFVIYFSLVWLSFKGILTFARLCLIENIHDNAGQDVRLYKRMRMLIIAGGVITALTVFIHQLPLIYELKSLFDTFFLIYLLFVSVVMLRAYHVLPNLILSQMENQHPYLQKSICFIGILVPLIMLGNSVVGLLGYVNLILTISWYECIFLIVLIGYLFLRGLLSDALEHVSRLMIQYVNNGWLWTEAVLKPLDKVLRIFLLLAAGAVLFLLYGWDKQSPIVERLSRLLDYQLITALNTVITPLNIIELTVVISVFYWTAKWTREFMYRMLLSRTKDMGIRNSIAILTQYTVIIVGIFMSMRVLGIDLRALAVVAGAFAFGVGLGMRDLFNNFACGFLILLERPLRVGDIVSFNNTDGEVLHIGSRAVTVRTWEHVELVVPNTEIFNKSFINWTATDNIVRTVLPIKISRADNPHEVKHLIQKVLMQHKEVLNDPPPEVLLKQMSESLIELEVRYHVNIRQIRSRKAVISSVLMSIWDEFALHNIKPPYPQQEIFIHSADNMPATR